jgi:O-antigen/teichoic acid export membrane protein
MVLLRWYPRIAEKRNELSGSVRKIATVGIGAAIVQVVTIALTPIITRLYSPDAFGGYALYWSVAAFFISVAALRYETAIVLARSDREAVNAVVVCLGASVINATLCLILAPLIAQEFVPANMMDETRRLIFFLPVLVLITALNQIIISWLTRKQEFRKFAISDVLTRLITYISQIVLALAGINGATGLIVGIVIGYSMAGIILTVWIVRNQDVSGFRNLHSKEIFQCLAKYRNLPLYLTPYTVVQTLRERAAYFMIGGYGRSFEVGYYSLSSRALALPVSLVAGIIRPIFFQKAAVSNLKDLEDRVNSVMRFMGLCVVPCWVILLLHHGTLFGAVFGKSWEGAGVYAAILSVPAIPFLLGSWLDRSFDIVSRQRLHFVIESIFTVMALLGLSIGIFIFRSVLIAIIIQSGVATVYYSCYLLVIYRIARFNARNLAVSVVYWLVAFVVAVVLGSVVSVFVTGISGALIFGALILFSVGAYVFLTISRLKNEQEVSNRHD